MLKKTPQLILAGVLALSTAPVALAEYEEYCLWNTGAYSAGFRIDIVKRGVDRNRPGEADAANSFYTGIADDSVNPGQTRCVSAREAGVRPGDGVRFYVNPLGDINDAGTRECGKHPDQTHGHEGFFLVPDGRPNGRLLFKSWGALYGPSCVVESGERMHSACAGAPDGMRNLGCNRWELDQNPRKSDLSLPDIIERDPGVGLFADLVERAGHDINRPRAADGATPLHAAAALGRAEYADFIIDRGGNLNARDNDGVTPVLKAMHPAEHGDIEMLEKLLNAGASPNLAADDGEFPLHLAARRGELEMVRLLVEADAILDAEHSVTGQSALAAARANNRADVAQFLLDNGAEDRLYPPDEEALDIVALDRGPELLEAAMRDGRDINAANTNGITAMHIAAADNKTEYVEALLALGADPNPRDREGRTPLMRAVEANHPFQTVVQILLQAGADINQPRNDGSFPLYLAAELARADVVRVIIHLADDLEVNQRNAVTGKTALGLAEELSGVSGKSEHAQIRRQLLRQNATQ